jgi:hypothetical protein
MSATGPVVEAVFSKLTANETLMSMVSGIIDGASVPEDQAYPFVAIGPDNSQVPNNEFGAKGYDVTLTFHIWDENHGPDGTYGMKRCREIYALIDGELDQEDLTIAGYTHCGTWFQFSEEMSEKQEEDLNHLPVEYMISVRKSA